MTGYRQKRELMAALAVGRSTIREVISHFQALGVVEARKGSGTYLLRAISGATIHMPLTLDTRHLRDALLQTLEVRRGIEVEAGMVAARRRTAADVVNIETKLNEMERVHLSKGTSDRRTSPSTWRSTTRPTIRSSGSCSSRCARPSSVSGKSLSTGRISPGGRFPFTNAFDAIASQNPDSAREETLKILAIVEEDIKEMSK